eukprot:TRINITY_DN1022_c0_g1_i1.p1 TRINITY_DN1022_c0_g1~~TRINITY_DN1022_c0_g1_i1.p1  ORF type:complete len:195 (+),score=42.64 TRINITY_DN1022_c0_g1_i1:136-720(+)
MALSWRASASAHAVPFLHTANSTTNTVKTRNPSLLNITCQKKVKKDLKVILTEDVPKVGNKGELVTVRAGHYRNFLGPRLQAQMATPQFLRELQLEQERKEAEKKRVKEEAQTWARMFEAAGPFKIKRQGGKGKLIFGSVTSQDVADVIKAQLQREVDKKLIYVPDIREVGLYLTPIKLHPEVTALVKVLVTTT